jgi:phage shock protein A
MGFFQRLSFLFRAKASKALDRAERPDEILDYSYQQQVELLQQVKRSVVDVVTARKQLAIQAERLDQSAAKLEEQARQALRLDREDLARRALERKSGIEQQRAQLQPQIDALATQEQQLVANRRALEQRVAAFRTEKEVVKAQYKAAEAQVRISEATSGIGEEVADVGLAVQRARDKTAQLQARAAAMDELVATGAVTDALGGSETALDRELAQLSSAAQVERELAELKAQLPAPELEPGSS